MLMEIERRFVGFIPFHFFLGSNFIQKNILQGLRPYPGQWKAWNEEGLEGNQTSRAENETHKKMLEAAALHKKGTSKPATSKFIFFIFLLMLRGGFRVTGLFAFW